jgi:ribosomal protein L6P/L9E
VDSQWIQLEVLSVMKRISVRSLALSTAFLMLGCAKILVADSGNPKISSVTPAQVAAGGQPFNLTVFGSGFVGNAVVLWNGSPRATQFISKTQLQASIASADIRQAGSVQVTVGDQRGNAVPSNSVFVTIQAAVPSLPAPTPVSVVISPVSVSLPVAMSQKFTAAVSGTTNTAVNWLVGGIAGGNSSVGTISTGGLYTAPSGVSTNPLTVTAQSAANSTSSANATVTILPAPTPVSASISPSSASVQVGRSQQFTATVTGTTNTAVNWLVGGIAGGNSSVGTISTGGLYTAPSSVPTNPVTVTAQSAYASTSSANATVTVLPAATPVSVSISPSSASVQVNQSQQFTAAISGTTNTAVNWLVAGILGGNSSVGTISPTGLYTAPSSVPANPVTVAAQSAYASTSSANATVTVLPAATPVSVSISPSSASVQVNQSQQFTAAISGTTNTAVNWLVAGILGGNSSVGTISSAGLYTAPSSVPTSPVTVTAQSAYTSTSSANATLTITPSPVSVSISPSSASVQVGRSQQFTAAVSGTTNTAVNWLVAGILGGNSSVGTISSTGLYTAPSSVPTSPVTVTAQSAYASTSSAKATLTIIPAPAQLTASPSSLNFGNVNIGSNGSLNLILTNSGNSTVTISNVAISGPGFNVSGSSGSILSPAQSTTLNVTFAPAATGSVTGSVTITSNAANSPASVGLSGMGVQPVTHSVTLGWIASSTPGVTGYNVYHATTSGGYTTPSNPTPISGTQFTDSTVQPGQTYYFVVNAIDAAGVESPYSNEVSGTIP